MINKTIKLKGISKHGKDRINQYGENWKIEQVVDKVAFSTEIGPWYGISSEVKNDFRWIHSNNDKDFKIKTILL